MDRHQSAEHAHDADIRESQLLHHPRHTARTGIVADRFGDIAIRIRITMQHLAKRSADGRQVEQIRAANDRIRRPVEIE